MCLSVQPGTLMALLKAALVMKPTLLPKAQQTVEV
jgi:hypothetical protein